MNPYAPLLDLLANDSAGRAIEESSASLAATVRELACLFPELAAHFLLPVAPAILDSAEHKRRAFYAFADLLTRLASDQPLVLILEDLHWGDDSSLEFLRYLARRITGRHIRLLVTCRNDVVLEGLEHLLAEYARERVSRELLLPRLAHDDVQAMVMAIFGLSGPARADFVAALFALTDGNPFFVEEVVQSLVAIGDISKDGRAWHREALASLRIPRKIHDAVRQRALGLNEQARGVLRLAAVMGRRFDLALIRSPSQLSEPELLVVLRTLVDRHLVVEESTDRFAFRHALTREAIYADLLAHERGSFTPRLHAV